MNTKRKVSFYTNAKDTTSQCWVDIDEILNFIKFPPQCLIEMTEEVRLLWAKDEVGYKEKKKELPLFCPSGRFTYRNSDLSNLLEYSNIIILDFDWSNPNSNEIEDFRQRLIQYATPLHIYAIWKSPAKGLKVAMLHSNTESTYHSELYFQIKKNLYPNTPQFDMSCKDIGRACFICYDPQLFINTDPNLTEYQFIHDPLWQSSLSITPLKTHACVNISFQHTSQEIMMNKGWQLICSDKRLMNMLVKSCNAANPNYYKDGNRHNEVLRRATLYCKDGILFDNAVWSLTGQFGEDSKAGLNNDDIESMVKSCY